ncbi:hypothetical protein Hanom_Chr16g01417721 [Helianthus anomalus]
MDGPCGLHFLTHLVPNLDTSKPLDLLVGVQTTGTILYFWKAMNQIQNCGKPQGLSVYFTLIKIVILYINRLSPMPGFSPIPNFFSLHLFGPFET